MRDLGAMLDHAEPLPHPACDQAQWLEKIRPREYPSRGPISYGARRTRAAIVAPSRHSDRRCQKGMRWQGTDNRDRRLRPLGVKRSLLNLRPLYQFPDPIEQSPIGEFGGQTMVMLDLAVEFDALVTHSNPPFFRPGETTSSSIINTTERRFRFNAPPSCGSGYFVSRLDNAVWAYAA